MRHGQTNYNVAGLCNDDPKQPAHLTELGKKQAIAAAQELKNAAFDKIIVSQLPRTRQTAEIVNRFHNAPILEHAGINDLHSGFDGQSVTKYQQAIAHDPLHAKANGGESLLEHKQRVIDFLEWLKTQKENSILVVAHEETLRVVAGFFQKLPDEQMRCLNFGNCEILAFEIPSG
jgi:alpha-ribazole phosphatase